MTKISFGKKSISDGFSSPFKIKSGIYIQYISLKGFGFNLLPQKVFSHCHVLRGYLRKQHCSETFSFASYIHEILRWKELIFTTFLSEVKKRKSVRVWFSFSLLWKCEAILQLVLTSSGLKFEFSQPSNNFHSTKTSRHDGSLLLQTATRGSSGWRAPFCKKFLPCWQERGLNTTTSSVQTHSCFLLTFHFIQLLAHWEIGLVESLLMEQTPFSRKNNYRRITQFHEEQQVKIFWENVP